MRNYVVIAPAEIPLSAALQWKMRLSNTLSLAANVHQPTAIQQQAFECVIE